jgi:membrane-associated phospholipid phosphatase
MTSDPAAPPAPPEPRESVADALARRVPAREARRPASLSKGSASWGRSTGWCTGVVAIGVSSATINLGVKPVARRRRPDRVRPALFEDRHVPMPGSTSFPSGHAASAFAFAYAVGRHLPALAVPIRLLAAAVAYSRVHTGVHYPGDVVIGSVAGSGTAAMVAAVADRAARARAVSDRAR